MTTQKAIERGNWLKQAREARGLTTRALAARAGISAPRITQIEKGGDCTRDMVERISRALTTEDADDHGYHALLNAGLKAAFPRPEDATASLSPAAALLRSTLAAQQAAENGKELTETQIDALIDDLEKFAEFSVTRETRKGTS